MTRHTETIETITRVQRRRHWSTAKKAALVCQTYEPGMSVSLKARQEGLASSLLFTLRRLEREGALVAVGAVEAVVPASEPAFAAPRSAIFNVCWERRPCRTRFLRKLSRSSPRKSGLRARPYCPGTTDEGGLPIARRGALESASAVSTAH